MTQDMQQRINRMFHRDRLFALVLLTCLWATIIFVFFAINRLIDDSALRVVMLAGALAVIVFNTASIAAMLKHYAEDRNAIYEIDIRHLDTMRDAKAKSRSTDTRFNNPAK